MHERKKKRVDRRCSALNSDCSLSLSLSRRKNKTKQKAVRARGKLSNKKSLLLSTTPTMPLQNWQTCSLCNQRFASGTQHAHKLTCPAKRALLSERAHDAAAAAAAAASAASEHHEHHSLIDDDGTDWGDVEGEAENGADGANERDDGPPQQQNQQNQQNQHQQQQGGANSTYINWQDTGAGSQWRLPFVARTPWHNPDDAIAPEQREVHAILLGMKAAHGLSATAFHEIVSVFHKLYTDPRTARFMPSAGADVLDNAAARNAIDVAVSGERA